MPMNNAYWRIILFLTVLGFSAVYFSIMPISEKDSSWGHNVLRNWDELGFARLGGKLITNPGGIAADGKLAVYGGHRPYSLFIPFLIGKGGGGFGGKGIAFYLLFSTAVFLGAKRLFGNGGEAFLGAALVLLCPGYVRMSVGIDTLTIPVLLGLPFLAALCRRICDPRPIGAGLAALMAVILLTYGVLNWTTAFVFAITGIYLALRIGFTSRRLILFALAVLAATGVVGVVSILHKMGGGTGDGSRSFQDIFDTYLWGAAGYAGYPMNWKSAITRIGAANLIGLLPIGGFLAFIAARYWKVVGRLPMKKFGPLAVAIASVAFMRNYFAQHPWMAASVFIVGIAFSGALLLHGLDARAVPASHGQLGISHLLALLGAGAYCFLVVTFFSVNKAENDQLITLVKQTTERRSLVILDETIDLSGEDQASKLAEQFDRSVVLLANAPPTGLENSPYTRGYILSRKKIASLGEPLAQTTDRSSPMAGIMASILNWYRTHIAIRDTTDRLAFSKTYYLYPYSPAMAQEP